MSGERRLAERWTATACAMWLGLVPAHAGGSGNTGLVDWMEDPLLTRPPVMETGPVLPGDGAPIACPANSALVDAKQPLTLDRAVDLALCHNPQVRAAWAAIKIQASALGEARAAYWPTANASLTKQRTRTWYPDVPNTGTTSSGHTAYASISWRLLDFGTRAANREAADQLLTAAMASHDATLQKTLFSVVGAYFDALTAHGALKARSDALQIAQSTLDATRRREQRGAAPVSDTLQANAALARARLVQQRAAGDYRKALSVLAYATGLPSTAQLDLVDGELSDESAAQRIQVISELEQWMVQAQTRHPAIAAAKAQAEAARARVAAARSEGLPSLDVAGNYYQNGYPNQALQASRSNVTTVGVTLSIPLFEGFSRTYKIRGAQAQVEQSEAQLQDVENQVLMEVVKAHADAVSAFGNLEASQTLLKAAEASVASSGRRYASGAADILELLATQATFADAQQERVRCLAEWRSARLRLLASAGGLGRDGLRLQ